ncbi:Alpha/Beta hydrolase protein [Tricladium varicosporioides]|nr:Alpha/Beta hydrolase protein [Hymenoscyphus varicosporioides]
MSTPNPLKGSYANPSLPVSVKTFHIAGILTDVYGLDEVSPLCKSISCLWLLHPRLQTKEIMGRAAADCITKWNQESSNHHNVGLIAVSFDQRNHGTRKVNPVANEAWRGGNDNHAQDMFSIFHGTSVDTSLLIDHLESYIFHGPDEPSIDQHLVMGISLGGHSAWQCLFNEPRITAGIVIIGCPDYMRLMSDRARLSKLPTYTSSDGTGFLNSKDFPRALISSTQKYDPKGIIFGTSDISSNPSQSEQKRIREILDTKLKGKRILVCSGGDDKLVPYHCAKPFLEFLKNATTGWYKDGNVQVEDNVYPGVGHAYSEGMVKDTVRFVSDTLTSVSNASDKPASKM